MNRKFVKFKELHLGRGEDFKDKNSYCYFYPDYYTTDVLIDIDNIISVETDEFYVSKYEKMPYYRFYVRSMSKDLMRYYIYKDTELNDLLKILNNTIE